MGRWFSLIFIATVVVGCAKADKDPVVFLPRLLSADGVDLEARRQELCRADKVSFEAPLLTPENVQAVFQCANYDKSFTDLEPLFESPVLPEFMQNVNAVLESNETRSMRETLDDWLADGPNGTSRVDRLLPLLAKIIKNDSFQAFLPVVDQILQAGRDVWHDLLPGLADVVYTEAFPRNVEDAFAIFRTFSAASSPTASDAEKNYAKSIKDMAAFLKSNLEGQTVSAYLLTMADDLKKLELTDTSLYEFFHRALESGTISQYFLNSSSVRGEVVDPKLNDKEDPPGEACQGLNETPEQRQQCAYQRLFRRARGGGDAPILQLADLVEEMQKDHPQLLPSLAAWLMNHQDQLVNAVGGYAIRGQLANNLQSLNAGNYLRQFARKNGMSLDTPVSGADLAKLVTDAFAAPDFAIFVKKAAVNINSGAFGERNAEQLGTDEIVPRVVALYGLPQVPAFAFTVVPAGESVTLGNAIGLFYNMHRRDAFTLTVGDKTQSFTDHLGDVWVDAVKAKLGEEITVRYVVGLAGNFLTSWADDFQKRNIPLSEWYFSSAYSNPGTTEALVGYATQEVGLLDKYYKHKQWLMNDFANEAFADNEDDKRAFRMFVDQVPNIILYIRSGMSRSGSDLTRALTVDQSGYLIKTYVQFLVKANQTGLIRKFARLMEAYQSRPGRGPVVAPTVSDDVDERRKLKLAVEAVERISRSLIQPEKKGDYSTSTVGRLVPVISTIVAEPRRDDTEAFLNRSAQVLLDLDDSKINDFFRDLDRVDPPGTVGERLQMYRSVSDIMKSPKFPLLMRDLSALFEAKAVQPALHYFAEKIDDGTLPDVLRFIRRLLGLGK